MMEWVSYIILLDPFQTFKYLMNIIFKCLHPPILVATNLISRCYPISSKSIKPNQIHHIDLIWVTWVCTQPIFRNSYGNRIKRKITRLSRVFIPTQTWLTTSIWKKIKTFNLFLCSQFFKVWRVANRALFNLPWEWVPLWEPVRED